MDTKIIKFLTESNKIEGVYDEESHQTALKAWNYLAKQDALTKDNILKTHAILMKGKLPHDQLGAWRREAVWIGRREAKPWYAIPDLMAEWIKDVTAYSHSYPPEEQNEEDMKNFHIRFEKIHPFIDGNGRMGRILLNWQREKGHKGILLILEQRKYEYYKWFE